MPEMLKHVDSQLDVNWKTTQYNDETSCHTILVIFTTLSFYLGYSAMLYYWALFPAHTCRRRQRRCRVYITTWWAEGGNEACCTAIAVAQEKRERKESSSLHCSSESLDTMITARCTPEIMKDWERKNCRRKGKEKGCEREGDVGIMSREKNSNLPQSLWMCTVRFCFHIRDAFEPFKAQWLLYAPVGFIFTYPAFCLHSVFMLLCVRVRACVLAHM
jgi:hypothetical protein